MDHESTPSSATDITNTTNTTNTANTANTANTTNTANMRAFDTFDSEYRRLFPRGGDESDHDDATRGALEAVISPYLPPNPPLTELLERDLPSRSEYEPDDPVPMVMVYRDFLVDVLNVCRGHAEMPIWCKVEDEAERLLSAPREDVER